MEYLVYLAIVAITTYSIFSISCFGIPPSISDTYYLWKDSVNNKFIGGHLFTVTLWIVAFPLMPYMLEASTISTQWLAFLSCGALAFVGAACEFQSNLTHTVHYASAFVWAIATILWIIINVAYEPVLIGLGVACLGVTCNRFKNATFWYEIGCIVALELALISEICGFGF